MHREQPRRELAPISDAAWSDLEAEARRTFTEHVAARRVVDVIGPAGETLAAVGTVTCGTIAAPAIEGRFLLSVRGGDYELYLGQDLSIGYLSHNPDQVELYFQESLTFIVQTSEAGVPLTAN